MAASMFHAIVVGTDGSAPAERALERAATIAAESGAPLHVVTAFQDGGLLRERLGTSARSDSVDLRMVAETVLERAANHVRRHGVEPKLHDCAGAPAEALLKVADDVGADLIVVGSRGLSRAERFLM